MGKSEREAKRGRPLTIRNGVLGLGSIIVTDISPTDLPSILFYNIFILYPIDATPSFIAQLKKKNFIFANFVHHQY